ncbi:MAG: reverse transcriptase N-terminal domain-containing protein [Candidatus Lokiarchaeota archaeon]|nr:reverse transcriptase N-terminal domain-containing protein [Candidatus Lokiarchaeota archaeon]
MEFVVREFQEEISRASKNRNMKKTNKLMKELVRSPEAKLLAIYKITQKNKGKHTAGNDGKKYETTAARMDLFKRRFDYRWYRFNKILVREIPKKNKDRNRKKFDGNNVVKKRKLGIMTLKDRVMTKIVSFALVAKWEPFLESNVMGYREGKSVQDCIHLACKELTKGNKIVLDADIKNFFENINHEAVLKHLQVFRRFVKRLLKIKVATPHKRARKNRRGIVQGSPLSPVLSNIALHGMQDLFDTQLIGNKLVKAGSKVSVIRYADDFVVFAPSRHAIESWVLPKIKDFLEHRGLSLNIEKTKIVTKEEGFTFLGYTIKQEGKDLLVFPEKNPKARRAKEIIHLAL